MHSSTVSLFFTLIVGIHSYQLSFQTTDNTWVPLSLYAPIDFSTEAPTTTNKNVATEELESNSNAEDSLTFDPHPNWRPYEFKHFVPMRDALKLMAKHDYQSKMVFDFFNQPSSKRAFIDGIFYSVECYIKEGKDFSTLDEESSHNSYAGTVEDQTNHLELHLEDTEIKEVYDAEQSSNFEEVAKTNPVEVGGDLNFNGESLRRSGLYLQVKAADTQTTDSTSEKKIVESPRFDSVSSIANQDTPVEQSEGSSTETFEHFQKDWSRERFPPIKTKIFINSEVESEQNREVPDYEIHKQSNSMKTDEEAAYKMEIASQAVEGALGLAEVIARETAQFVSRITMEALKHNIERSKVGSVYSKRRIQPKKTYVVQNESN